MKLLTPISIGIISKIGKKPYFQRHSYYGTLQYVVLSTSCRFYVVGGQSQRRLLVVILLINKTILQIDGLCWAPTIQDKSNINSEVQYSIIGRTTYVFKILNVSRSVRKPYLRASHHVCILIGCWCTAFPFLRRNCLWLPLRVSSIIQRAVGNLTSTRKMNGNEEE